MPSSVDGEIVLFDGVTGLEVKSATGTGLVTATSGVYGTTTAPTFSDFSNANHDHGDADDGGTLNASAIAAGSLAMARGGLAADVSGFSGLVKIAAGTASAVTAPSGTVVGTTDDQALTTKIITFKAGTASAGTAPIKLTSGTSLTTAEAGAIEYDGALYYSTGHATPGRGYVPSYHFFRLTGDGSALGPTIADFFGANSAIDLPASSAWELEAHLYYLKTTAGTVTYTITNSAADYTNIAAHFIQTVGAGMGATGAHGGAGIVTTTTAAAALPSTASLTSAVNHKAIVYATIEMNGAGNVRLRITTSSGGGTTTPLRGSFFRLTRIPTSVGNFVA